MKPFLLVSADFVPTGGMDMPNLALATYLADRGHPVHLVAHRVAPDIAVRRSAVFHRVPKPAGSYWLASPLLMRTGRRLAAEVAALGGRVVVNGGNCGWNDVNWIHYVHAAYAPRTEGLRRLWAGLRHRMYLSDERSIVRRARVVIANSHRTKRDLVERVRVSESRIHVVYYGIDGDRFRPTGPQRRAEIRAAMGWPQDRPMAVFLGALGDRRKGFDTLFAAWKMLCADSGWNADLAVVGSGAELPAWRQRAARAGLQGRIRFLGFRSDVPEILGAADVLVSPTRYEAYGQGVHEALCGGLPAFVSRDAGVAERYPPELSELLLPDPDDASDLAARLRAWLSGRNRWRDLVAPLSDSLRRRSWDDMAAELVERIG